MHDFGISRPSLREAVRILESEGLITVRRGAHGGARVLRPSADVAARYASVVLQHRGTPLSDVLDARSIVETPAARLVATRRDRRRAAKELLHLVDHTPSAELSRGHAFNAKLVELTGSRTLKLLTTMLEDIINAAAEAAIGGAHVAVDVFVRESDRSRRSLITAIGEGDADGAERAWREHLDAERGLLTEGSDRALADVFPSQTGKNAELVAARLRRSIVTGELGENDQVPAEAHLTQQFGVSRPTLREAFRILESEGLIEVRRGAHGGARIKLPTEDAVARYACLLLEYDRATVADVSTVRALLEPSCASRICARHDTVAVAKLTEAVDATDAVVDPVARLDAQHSFHMLLVELAGNRTIGLLHAALQQILEAAGRRSAAVPGPASEAAQHEGARSHRRLVELMQRGEAERAEQLWRRHLEATTTYLERTGSVLDVLALR